MKKRIFALFLVLVFLLTALAGCKNDASGDSSKSPDQTEDNEEEQLLASGYYEVYDEDDELVGYLQVKGSKLVVYDEHGNQEDSLRYDYDAKDELYTLDDGELFGCEEFTVKKSKNALTLVTEDDDEYTLKEIDKGDIPDGGDENLPGGDASGYVELPIGCYAGYENGYVMGYIKVTGSKMIFYYDDGDIEGEFGYSYDRDGSCTLDFDGAAIAVRFTYEQGSYYISIEDTDETRRLESISESEIPVYNDGPSGPSSDAYYIGGNGYVDLYAWMPDGLYDDLYTDYEDGGFTATAEYHDDRANADLMFYTVAASGDFLQEAIDEAKADYNGSYSSDADLLFCYLRDNFLISSLGDDFPGNVGEGYETINGREWRGCEVYAEDEGIEFVLLFWMEGDDMVMVMVGGYVERSGGYDNMTDIVGNIMYSLELDI